MCYKAVQRELTRRTQAKNVPCIFMVLVSVYLTPIKIQLEYLHAFICETPKMYVQSEHFVRTKVVFPYAGVLFFWCVAGVSAKQFTSLSCLAPQRQLIACVDWTHHSIDCLATRSSTLVYDSVWRNGLIGNGSETRTNTKLESYITATRITHNGSCRWIDEARERSK